MRDHSGGDRTVMGSFVCATYATVRAAGGVTWSTKK